MKLVDPPRIRSNLQSVLSCPKQDEVQGRDQTRPRLRSLVKVLYLFLCMNYLWDKIRTGPTWSGWLMCRGKSCCTRMLGVKALGVLKVFSILICFLFVKHVACACAICMLKWPIGIRILKAVCWQDNFNECDGKVLTACQRFFDKSFHLPFEDFQDTPLHLHLE